MSRDLETVLAVLSAQQREAVEALVRLSPAAIPAKARRDAVTAFPLCPKSEKSEAETEVTPVRQGKPVEP